MKLSSPLTFALAALSFALPLVAYAKANPNKVNFGSAGIGSSNPLSGGVAPVPGRRVDDGAQLTRLFSLTNEDWARMRAV
jgi:hypothetical protein